VKPLHAGGVVNSFQNAMRGCDLLEEQEKLKTRSEECIEIEKRVRESFGLLDRRCLFAERGEREATTEYTESKGST